MKVRASRKSIWLELGVLLTLLALVLPCAPTPHSSAQKPQANRQLKRDPAPQQKRAGQTRIALVTGNGADQNANPLKNPPNDARASPTCYSFPACLWTKPTVARSN